MDVSHYLQRLQNMMPKATEAIARQDWERLRADLVAMAVELRLAQSACMVLEDQREDLAQRQTEADTARKIAAARKRYHEDLGKRMFGTDW